MTDHDHVLRYRENQTQDLLVPHGTEAYLTRSQWKSENLMENSSSSKSASASSATTALSKPQPTSQNANAIQCYVLPTDRLRPDSLNHLLDFSAYESIPMNKFYLDACAYCYSIHLPNHELKPIGRIHVYYHDEVGRFHPREVTSPITFAYSPSIFESIDTSNATAILQELLAYLNLTYIIAKINENRNQAYFSYDIVLPKIVLEVLAITSPMMGMIQYEVNKWIVQIINSLFYRKYNYKSMEYLYSRVGEDGSGGVVTSCGCFNLLECYRSKYLHVTVVKEVYKQGHR
jgi:hypothetical protein